jgi:hypothetical protein
VKPISADSSGKISAIGQPKPTGVKQLSTVLSNGEAAFLKGFRPIWINQRSDARPRSPKPLGRSLWELICSR